MRTGFLVVDAELLEQAQDELVAGTAAVGGVERIAQGFRKARASRLAAPPATPNPAGR